MLKGKNKASGGGNSEVYWIGIIGALVIALWGFALSAADINKGYTFLTTDHVTSTKLNNLMDAATIAPSFITGQAADINLAGADSMVLYSVSGAGLRKVTLDTLSQQIWTNSATFTGLTNDPSPDPGVQYLAYNAAGTGLELIYRTNASWERYTSPAFAFTYAFGTNLAHGLTNTPQFVRWVLVNVAQQDGYYPGDEIPVESVCIYLAETGSGAANHLAVPAFTAGANSTNVFIHCATNIWAALPNAYLFNNTNVTSTATRMTNADWRLKCYARYWP